MSRLINGLLLLLFITNCYSLPQGFVYAHDYVPRLVEDMRYASSNNFTGKPVPGYQAGTCILSLPAAKRLAVVQRQALKLGYRLKVYDCYRPKKSVAAFYKWSQKPDKGKQLKEHFYPREAKTALFDKGYISLASGHSRGSTVDLTLIKIKTPVFDRHPGKRCYSQSQSHIDDNSINTGTRFDCLDPSAHVFYPYLTLQQKSNRMVLRKLMIKNGFTPYGKEWWHFTLNNEPYPHKYFNFAVK